MKHIYSTFLSLIAFSCLTPAHAQGSMLDFSFGTGGKVTYPLVTDALTKMLLQPDGKILFGSCPINDSVIFTILRYNSDGTLDNGFDGDGKLIRPLGTGYNSFSMALQPEGKILAASAVVTSPGNADFIVIRLNADGSTDSTFGINGTTITDVSGTWENLNALTIQSDGKIIAGGTESGFSYETSCFARYNPNGSLDSTFGTGGKAVINISGGGSITDVAVQPGGKIMACGTFDGAAGETYPMVMRLNANGTLDTTFGAGGFSGSLAGWELPGRMSQLALLPDGRIYGVGYVLNPAIEKNQFQVNRYLPNGTADNTFATNGGFNSLVIEGVDAESFSLSIQPDAKLIVAGFTNADFVMIRLNADGSRDSSFGGIGLAYADFGGNDIAFSSAIQPDGKIILAGEGPSEMAMARFNPNALGIAEKENNHLVKVFPNPFSEVLNIQNNNAVMQVKLTDMSGKTVFERQNLNTTGLQVDLSICQSGIYCLTVMGKSSIYCTKVIKQ